MNVLTLRHHEMVNRMLAALNHNAHEAERLKLGNLVWVIAGHDKSYAVRQSFSSGVPADRDEFVNVRRQHTLYRVERATFTRD